MFHKTSNISNYREKEKDEDGIFIPTSIRRCFNFICIQSLLRLK